MSGKKLNVNAIVETIIEDFVARYASEKMERSIWQKPIVGYTRANDPLFWDLKQLVSKTHATPKELLPGAKSVVVYYLPFIKEIPLSNKTDKAASEEWAVAYVETNGLIIALNNHLAKKLGEYGFLSKVLPPTHNFDTKSLVSDWSHKHVAYIAGLGNFGYHHQLITEKGCCGRLGSLITEAPLAPTLAVSTEYCLQKYNGSCRICSQRCPVDAISDADFVRQDCYRVLIENMDRYKHLGLTDVCGKCVSMVPCSFLSPAKKQMRKELNKDLEIVEVEEQDLSTILDLQKAAYQFEADRYADPGLPPMLQTLESIKNEFKEQLFLKVVFKNKIIASVRAKFEDDTCSINKLFVDPKYFGLGVGRVLMETLESMPTKTKRFELFTGHKSTPALNLYRSMGYVEFQRKEMATHTLVYLRKKTGI